MELTLKNLMTVVRSRRDAGMDEYIDDSYTGRRRSGDAQTIDSQVASAFEYNAAMLTEDEIKAYSQKTNGYYYEYETIKGD